MSVLFVVARLDSMNPVPRSSPPANAVIFGPFLSCILPAIGIVIAKKNSIIENASVCSEFVQLYVFSSVAPNIPHVYVTPSIRLIITPPITMSHLFSFLFVVFFVCIVYLNL